MSDFYIKVKVVSSLDEEATIEKMKQGVNLGIELLLIPEVIGIKRIELYKSGIKNLWGLL